MNIQDYPAAVSTVTAIGQKPDGTPALINVDEDGNLITGITVTGDITLGVVQIDQTTANANEVVVKTIPLAENAATQTTSEEILERLSTDPSTATLQGSTNTKLDTVIGKLTAVNTGAVTVAASALPTGAATDAKQPALGTAGTASTDVLSVQGIANGTALAISGSVTNTPVAVSLANSTAYAASLVVKASAGKLFSISGYNSGPAQFVQIHNAASLPANTSVPVMVIAVPSQSTFAFDFAGLGLPLSTGCVAANSSTGPTLTIGSSNIFFTAVYL